MTDDRSAGEGEVRVAGLVGAAEAVADAPVELKEAGLTQRDALLEVCDRAEIWRSPEGETYATVPADDHVEHHAIAVRGFRDWMVGAMARRYMQKGRPASSSESAVRDARMGLEARAHMSGSRKDVPLRVAEYQGRIYLDLGEPDWAAIEVALDGWRRVPTAPVPIMRTRRTAAFPEPDRDGGFAALRTLLRRLPDDDFIMFIAWCLGAFLPAGPYPILIFGGEQGSGKSTLARLAQRLTDPVTGDLLQSPGDDRDLIAAARNNRVLAFDNFSGIRAELADSLCRLATGSEIGGRALYSNHDTASFSACRPLILNGIPDLAARGDLADRSIMLRLDAPAERMTERDWARAVHAVLPSTLAGFLEALVTGLTRLDATPTPDVRMADFARFIVAAERSLPWAPGAFLAAYRRNRGQAVAALAEGDLVASAVRTFIGEGPEGWKGLVSALYETLSTTVSPEHRRSGDWPGNARWFSDRLRRVAPSLRALGVDIAEHRDGQGLKVDIRFVASLATLPTSAGTAGRASDDANVASAAIDPVSDAPMRWAGRV